METVLDNKKAPWGGGYSWHKKNHKASFYWLFGSGMLSTENYKKHEIVCTPELDTHS